MQPHQRGALMPNLLQRWAPCGQRSLESNDGESDELSVITEVRRNRGKSADVTCIRCLTLWSSQPQFLYGKYRGRLEQSRKERKPPKWHISGEEGLRHSPPSQ
eukprot:1155994-Pelagomonas_calceolata.AAC.4